MYTIKEAAARAGLTPTVARAWERRYGVVEPARTASGYRLYDDAAIGRLQTMRRLVEDGWTASAAARAVADGTAPDPAHRAPSPTTASVDPIEAFVAAAAALDGDAIETSLDELFGRGSFEAIVDAWLMPAAAALGDAWESGRVSVAGEHAASAALARRLAGATALPRRGQPVLYLGADVPVASWLYVRDRLQPRLLVVAVVTADDRSAAREVAQAVRAEGHGTPVAFGGRASDAAADVVEGSTVLPESIVGAAERAVALVQG